MLNKFAKVIMGLFVGALLVIGAKTNVKAQTVFVWDAYGIHMLDSEEDNIPNGIMAYDIAPDWSSMNMDPYAMLMNMYGTPSFEVQEYNMDLSVYMQNMMLGNLMMQSELSNEFSMDIYSGMPQLEGNALSANLLNEYPLVFSDQVSMFDYYIALHELAFKQKNGLR